MKSDFKDIGEQRTLTLQMALLRFYYYKFYSHAEIIIWDSRSYFLPSHFSMHKNI